jgi:hypothetical protein
MKNPDEAIERVLTGLRDAESPDGMNRRILDAMPDGASPQRNQGRMWLTTRPSLIGARTWAIAAAGIVVVSLICWTALRSHRILHDTATVKRQEMPANIPIPAPETQPTAAQAVQPIPQRPIGESRHKTDAPKPVRQEESTPQHETVAENHPAPEAPPTEEERLLLRFAHRADPQQLEAFNPALQSARSLWAAQEKEEKAEFQRFFEPPPTTNNE